jgi:hypothetical protein
MKEDSRMGFWLRQTEDICGHMWHRYIVVAYKVVMATVLFSMWWLETPGAVVVVMVWWLDLQLSMLSVSITTNVVSSNPTQAIQHHVIKFVSDIRQVGGFLRYSGFLHDITEILLKVTLSIINLCQLETLGSVTFL